MRLLGFRVERDVPDYISIYPYWYVEYTPANSLRAHWEITRLDGTVVSSVTAYPYFNTLHAATWPRGTLVDDAYRLPLPPGLPAGQFEIALRLGESQSALNQAAVPIGKLTLKRAAPGQKQPDVSLDVRVGDTVRLAGYDVLVTGQETQAAAARPLVVRSGQYLEYRLYWQATGSVEHNYHGFVHLVDRSGRPLVQQDQLPGPFFSPPLLWDNYHLQTDTYLLRIPADAPSGLYWPNAGLYDFGSQDRLPVHTLGAATADDHVTLPPVKIINGSLERPQTRVTACFDDLATLLGYDLTIPESGLQPNGRFTVTLYYRSEHTTDVDYTRFLQLYNPANGMAAQQDGPPQAGDNPTFSWMPGEVIREQVELTISRNARPGRYGLFVGFYNPKAQGARLPVVGSDGRHVPENWARLIDLTVEPAATSR